jgi:hypothetical protein
VLETLAKFVEKSQVELFMVKLKMALLCMGGKNEKGERKMSEETQ